MRKLRSDITVAEYAAVMKKRGYLVPPFVADLLGETMGTSVPFDWPESFYESPPIGSFGNGGTCADDIFRSDYIIWGHLEKIITGKENPYLVGGRRCKSFTPGLPDDVDENGYPKEEK